MSEFIGARISLISKSDIRYVGTLHEINSENSTVALENVKSYGTEGRRGDPANEVGPSDQPYEYIVFRGSDVKDLRVEKQNEPEPKKPQNVPDDPAILGSSRPPPTGPAQQTQQPPTQPRNNGPYGQPFPPQGQYQQYQQRFPPQQPRFGAGPMGPYAFPSGPQSSFPYPPPGYQGRGPAPPFPPGPYGPTQGFAPPKGPQHRGSQGPPPSVPASGPAQELPEQTIEQTPSNRFPSSAPVSAPAPPVDSKPPPEAAIAPPARDAGSTQKSTKITPAMPLPLSKASQPPSVPQATFSQPPAQTTSSTEAAKAAVAAAMAKLQSAPAQPQNGGPAVDNLTKQFYNLRTDQTRGGRAGYRGNRGNARRGSRQPMEVPKTDFDFEGSNAKFNKSDLLRDTTTSPAAEDDVPHGENGNGDVTIPAPLYNPSAGFFDNISSEAKEKEDASANGRKQSMYDQRSEERKRNIETFGMGTVDHAYNRSGYRGRGRGRGYRGRGAPRGRGQARGDAAVF